MNLKANPFIKMLLADKKKLSFMLAALALGLLLWGRLLLQQLPRTAQATPTAALSGAANLSAPGAAQAQGSRPTVAVDLPAALSRDLFALNPGFYRAAVTQNVLLPSNVEKSPPQRTDESQQESPTGPDATGLRLQTVIMGDRPRAVINGKLLEPGQTVNGFVLRKITQRQVTLERDGVEIQLGM